MVWGQAYGDVSFRLRGNSPWVDWARGIGAIRTSVDRKLVAPGQWFHVAADRENGRLMLTDKITGQVFDSLHIFEDGGDRGDEYNYCPPAQDQFITTPTKSPVIECWDAGTQGQTLLIKAEYVITSDLSTDRDARSDEITTLPITSR